MSDWQLVIHGGSGSMTRERLPEADDQAIRAALDAALSAGAAVLAIGGIALDAVGAAIRVLEDDVNFNAGRGSVYNWDGRIECDAAVMDGAGRLAGAVAGVTATRHPVDLARVVLERSPHVLLAGEGADAFSRARGLEQAPPSWFGTPERWRQLAEIKADPDAPFDSGMKYGTVGAVARDQVGRLASATSTGGLTAKRWGRIGDSPLIGAGTWADKRTAVSCTGSGEHFIRLGVAHEMAARVRLAGETPEAAAAALIRDLEAIGGKGGIIWASDAGPGWAFNTPGMHRARACADGQRIVAIYADEA